MVGAQISSGSTVSAPVELAVVFGARLTLIQSLFPSVSARRSATGITLEGLPQALSAFDSGGDFSSQMKRGVTLSCVSVPLFPPLQGVSC